MKDIVSFLVCLKGDRKMSNKASDVLSLKEGLGVIPNSMATKATVHNIWYYFLNKIIISEVR